MNLLPKIKECPCCGSINLFRMNGENLENKFRILSNWKLKKLINCRKCKIEFGLYTNNEHKKVEKVVWMELLKCEDVCLDQLIKLQNKRDKYKKKFKEKEYKNTLQQIQAMQNEIRLNQNKVRIKAKMQNLHIHSLQV